MKLSAARLKVRNWIHAVFDLGRISANPHELKEAVNRVENAERYMYTRKERKKKP